MRTVEFARIHLPLGTHRRTGRRTPEVRNRPGSLATDEG